MLYNTIMKKLFTLFIVFLTVFLTACNTAASTTLFYFNAPVSLNFYDGNKLNTLTNDIKKILEEIHDNTDTQNVNSDVSKFNALQENESVTISDATKDILTIALEVEEMTNGAFNPAIYPLTELWQFSADTYKKNDFNLPSDKEIEEVLPLCNCKNFKLEGNTLTKLSGGVKLDLGGITKGYACDRLYEYLTEKNLKQGYISMGSSSIALFEKKNSKFWDLSIRHPDDENETLIKIKLANIQVSTSGIYERYYDYDGKKYSHILDCTTGYPIDNGIKSVTVICKSGAYADALSTALCVMGVEKAINFVKSYNEINTDKLTVIIAYTESGKNYYYTNAEDYKLLDKNYIQRLIV